MLLIRLGFLIIIAAFFANCSSSIEKTTITITSSESQLEKATLIRPIDGMILWQSKKDTIFGFSGKLYKELSIDYPEVVRLVINDTWLRLIIQPGRSYNINIDGENITYKGENASGNQFFNTIKRPTSEYLLDVFDRDTVISQITEKVDTIKKKELDQLNRLFEDQKIDNEFYTLLKKDIDYDHANLLLKALYYKQTYGEHLQGNIDSLTNSIINKYPIETNPLPLYWNQYTNTYTIDKERAYQIKSGQLSVNQLQQYWEEDKLHFLNVNILKSGFTSVYREKAIAYYLKQSLKQQKFERSLLSIYKDFQAEFPKSAYIPYLKPDIEEIKEYYNKAAQELPDKIVIIGDTIQTLPELLQKFQGQKLYIDVWATWCVPCVREFKHNKENEEVLEKYGYQKLYISFDNVSKRNKWIQMMKYYNLEGTHFLANKLFINDFSDNYSLNKGGYSIPQYFLIDEKGSILSKNAPRPSENDKLEKTLKSL